MLDEHIIRDFSNKIYSKNQFLEELKTYNDLGFNVYIGTDSKIIKNKIAIVSAICFHKPGISGTSGKIFYIKEKINKKQYASLRARMLLEAYRSIEIAMELENLFSNKLEVHLDVGDTIRSKTAAYEQELQSLVISQGYNCVIKPFSWAGSAAADRIVKGIRKEDKTNRAGKLPSAQ